MRRNWLFGGILAAIGAIFVSVGAVQAAFDAGMIGVSFGGKDAAPVGKAVVGSDADKWNAPDGHQGKSIALLDVTGAKTDVRLDFDADRTWDAVSDSPFLGGPYENLLRHYLVAEREYDVALTGLTPGARYSLYLYSALNRDNRLTKFVVGEQTKSTTFSIEKKELAAGVNYAHFVVTADKDGNVKIVYSGGEGPEGNFNGLQITPAKGAEVAADDATPPKPPVVKPAPRTSKKPRSQAGVMKKLGPSRPAGEWPCWRGPNRDGKSPDTGLLNEWPEGGPSLVWQLDNVGPGFASVAVSGATVYTSGDVKNKLMISAIDIDGTLKWQAEAAPSGPAGSRSTPTVDGDRIYLLAGNGQIGCYDAASGEKKWSHAAREFGGSPGTWAYAESVLIHKNMAIFKPGGKNCIVALDKTSGETIWTSSGFDAGPEYSSCIIVTFEGQPMIVTGTNKGIVAVDPASGKLLWSNEFSARNTANCPTPAYADGYVFWANGYGKGGICLKLAKEGDKVTADVAWTTKDMECHHGGYIIHEGYVYGNNRGGWVCLDLKTGEKKWEEKAVGKGSLCFADGMLYLFSEKDGQAGLATCSPSGLQVKGHVKVDGSGPSWSHPVVVGGRLFLRYDTNLYCFDVKKAN